MDRATRHLTDLDRYDTATLGMMAAGYDRLVARYLGDATYAAVVAYWMLARDAVTAALAARPAVSYPPLVDVGGSWS